MKIRRRINIHLIQRIESVFSILLWVVMVINLIQLVAMAEGLQNNREDLSTLSLSQAGKEFQKLRAIKGHFDGGPFNPEVDGWKGFKHQLMTHIAQKIKNQSISESELLSILGPPDKRLTEGECYTQLVKTLPDYKRFLKKESVILIYQWRGNHDVLFFISQSDSIVRTAWWHAGE